MAQREEDAVVLADVRQSLQPFIRSRQETLRLRRTAASSLGAVVKEQALSRPLSLLSPCHILDTSALRTKGLEIEYIRCLEYNNKVKEACVQLNQSCKFERGTCSRNVNSFCKASPASNAETYSNARERQCEFERLRIFHDYLTLLSRKPAAQTDHLDLQHILKNIDVLPKIPQEILHRCDLNKGYEKDLKDLICNLERAVLRAKLQLQQEQSLLAKIKKRQPTSPESRLQAIANTRNELINWIEAELAKTVESSDNEDETPRTPAYFCPMSTDSELISIQKKYFEYTKLRQSLILSSSTKPELYDDIDRLDDHLDAFFHDKPGTHLNSHVVHPYLQNIVAVSSEQKALIQQKSFLTVSLAKQLRDNSQDLRRLAGESHILPSYADLDDERKKAKILESFEDTIAAHEVPSFSCHGQAWSSASASVRVLIRDLILKTLAHGNSTNVISQQSLLELHDLVGQDGDVKGVAETAVTTRSGSLQDVWCSIDGNLSAIKHDDFEIGETLSNMLCSFNMARVS